ncbi:MAG TPA: type III pantothenate kinase [Steroidobacteraceae bacterium]
MKLLLVDIGNSRVKWAWVRDGRLGRQRAAANAQWQVHDYARRLIGGNWRPGSRIVVSSVAGADVDRIFVRAARAVSAPSPEFFASRRTVAGVKTAYLEPWRLGVDRLAGAIGARHLARGRPVCLVNVGTAITIDVVDQGGRHRGGAIIPGPPMMVASLLRDTSGIRRRAQGGARGVQTLFARTTRTAIAQGSRYAAAAVIDRAILEARRVLGRRPAVFLTGGGLPAVKPLLRVASVTVPDLVLVGLAVWAGQSPLGRRVN